jgi:hypothetical protein
MRPPADPFLPGPHRALTFRPPRGSPGDIITTVALFLAASSARGWLLMLTQPLTITGCLVFWSNSE